MEEQLLFSIATPRFLNENSTNSTSEEEASQPNDAEVLKQTFLVYGLIFVAWFLLFCFIRRKWKRPYTIRQWVDDLKTSLADDQYGFFSWLWRLCMISDDEILDDCGMDALCFTRCLRMGYKISVVGALNAIWLMPVYATAEPSPETSYITDGFLKTTISHVPAGSNRLIGTTIAAYILIFYSMYLILKEFEWFVENRHKFLTKPKARNYAAFVRNVPMEYRNNAAFKTFFENSTSQNTVLDAHLAVKAPNLAKLVSKRDAVITKLEHAIAVEDVTGVTPTHRSSIVVGVGEECNSIETYAEELRLLNREVTERIDAIEEKTGSASADFMDDIEEQRQALLASSDARTGDDNLQAASTESSLSQSHQEDVQQDASNEDEAKTNVTQSIMKLGTAGAGVAASAATSAVRFVTGGEDGELLQAGFVSFKQLSSVQATLQMVQHEKPFAMEVIEAPDPGDVFWPNISRTHKDLQLGSLFSLIATTALCLLWTIPMAFFASLSSVSALKEQIPFIGTLLEAAPWLEPFFELIAPLLVKIVNALLPTILTLISMLEGPISGAVVEASLFSKLAAFMIIQTFFVSAISGGVLQALQAIIMNPTLIVDLLANSLPAQATYFIQIVFVSTCIGTGVELLRVVPIALASIRSFVGPNLTEKERATTFLGLRPLADPAEFQHADMLSQVVLFFVVLLVYAVISPLTCFITGFSFLYMASCYRHQFVYIYPTTPDSGGKLWTNFINILVACLMIAEITIIGLLLLKKSPIATPLMVPLIIVTALFIAYIRQQHFRVAEYLPAKACVKADAKNGPNFDLSFVRGEFIQPFLQVKEAFPEMSADREIALALRTSEQFMTPDNSERPLTSDEVVEEAIDQPSKDADAKKPATVSFAL